MRSFRKLAALVVAILILGVPVLADCSVDPGIMSTPPCAIAQGAPDDSQTVDQTVSEAQSASETQLIISEVATEIVANFLMVF